MYKVIFHKHLVLRCNPVTSMKCRHRPFTGKLPTISEHSKETFSLEPVAEAGNQGEKQGQFC